MLSVVVLTGLFQQKNSNFEGVTWRKFAATGMSASKFSVQFGLRCNWRISMLKVLHAAICCAQGFSLSELAFAPPFSGIYTHLYLYLFMLFSDIYIYICILCMPTSVYNFSHLSRTFLAHVLRPNFFFTAVPVSLHTAAVSLHCRKKDSGDMRQLSTSLHVSTFSSPISTLMWPLAFVHPPRASSCCAAQTCERFCNTHLLYPIPIENLHIRDWGLHRNSGLARGVPPMTEES